MDSKLVYSKCNSFQNIAKTFWKSWSLELCSGPIYIKKVKYQARDRELGVQGSTACLSGVRPWSTQTPQGEERNENVKHSNDKVSTLSTARGPFSK